MDPMHSLLRRQLKRRFGDGYDVPGEWQGFIAAVDEAYRAFDADRLMLERSLELSSQELLQANSEMRAIFQTLPDLLFRIDHQGRILSIKAGDPDDLMLPAEKLHGRRLQDVPLPTAGEQFAEAIRRSLEQKMVTSLEYFIAKKGQQRAYEARLVPLREDQLIVIVRNITERHRSETMREGQHRTLEMIATGAPLRDTFVQLVKLVEAQSEGMICSLLVIGPDGKRLWTGAAPGLPESYCGAINGVEIGEGVGSCGTAAFRRKTVIVSDIQQDPLWENYRELAAQHQLRACWSEPIISNNDTLLGTFAVYYREPRTPTAAELRLIGVASHLAGIAIERKRAEEELFSSQQMLRTVLDTIPQRVFWKDRNSVYVGCNRPLARDCGCNDPSEMVGKTDFDTDAKDIAEIYRADDRYVIDSNRPKLNYEEPQTSGDGSTRWLRTSKVPLHDKFGEVIGVLGTYEDITERKRAEEALRTSEERYRALYRDNPSMFFTLDATGTVVSVNQFGAHQLGCTIAELEGRSVLEIYHEEDRASVKAELQRCLENPWQVYHWQFRKVCKDGSLLWVEEFARAVNNAAGALSVLVVCHDITERKKVEEALRQEEERFRHVTLATRDAIYDWDIASGTVWRNEAYQALYSPNEPMGQDKRWWEQHVHPDDRREIIETQRKAFQNRTRLWSAEYRLRRWDGSYATVIDRGYIIYDETGQPMRMIGAMTDITERKRLEEQFRQVQKMEAFGQLAGGVAHDFNNLLTVMMGSVSMLRLGGLSRSEEQAAIEDCFRAAQRASNLTRQLLTFSRRQPLEPKALDLNEVVANMTKMFQRLIGEHITLETRYVPGGAHINADPGMMEQALMNLAVNSRDAMPKGGRLLLQTSVIEVDEDDIGSRPNASPGSYVRLSVSDTGVGIAPEHLPHIFEPFFTTKEVGKGTGLGLATLFGIVEQHAGWIDVESRVGEGSTFHVYLPLIRRDTRSGFPRPTTPPPRKGSETILVVEDEPSVRKLMLTLLERHGYRVHSAHSGAAALKIWPELRNSIDLLITDMVMPDGVGGRELSDRLRADKPGLRVIHCSGYTDEMLGADIRLRSDPYFLEKPFDLHVFLQRVRDCLDAREPATT